MKVSDCFERGPENDQGLCPLCHDHCEWVDDEDVEVNDQAVECAIESRGDRERHERAVEGRVRG